VAAVQEPRFRLLIADCRPVAAHGMVAALGDADDLVVDAICHESGQLGPALNPSRGIDAVVIDAEMFDGDASSTVEAVRGVDSAVAVLLLTTRVDAALLEALAYEGVSCVSAYSEAQAIVFALRALLAGETLLPAQVQHALTETLRRPASPPMLTPREEQVLELAATGLTISEIAASLHISHSTAKTHLLRVYGKLEAPNRSAAVATAVARGLLQLSRSAA
jgi:DNA-binding NarL/FixJ family response regulator